MGSETIDLFARERAILHLNTYLFGLAAFAVLFFAALLATWAPRISVALGVGIIGKLIWDLREISGGNGAWTVLIVVFYGVPVTFLGWTLIKGGLMGIDLEAERRSKPVSSPAPATRRASVIAPSTEVSPPVAREPARRLEGVIPPRPAVVAAPPEPSQPKSGPVVLALIGLLVGSFVVYVLIPTLWSHFFDLPGEYQKIAWLGAAALLALGVSRELQTARLAEGLRRWRRLVLSLTGLLLIVLLAAIARAIFHVATN